MSEPTIQPALDAEAWAEGRLQFLSAPELTVHDDGDGLEFVVYPDAEAAYARRGLVGKYKIEAWATDDLAALIALANAALPDDDARKITPKKIDSMRRAIGMLKADRVWQMSPVVGQMERFADALESYLPPKETA